MDDVVGEARGTRFKVEGLHHAKNAASPTRSVRHEKDKSTSHPKYRPDIDGLRALAVASVVIYHAFPRRLTGGYAGVDIFFVISGFLISSILFASFQQGTFSFSDFYTRRARRIFPALITVLLPVGLVSWYIFTPDEFSTLGKHIAAGSGFVANVALWLESGYFDTASDVKPLLHLWSLGVEEQFYIVWPLLLWGTWRFRANVLIVGGLLAAASFIANIAGITSHPEAVFYLPVSRFWELLGGAALAYVTVSRKIVDAGSLFASAKIRAAINNVLGLAGLAFLLVALTSLDTSLAFPGWWAVLPVAGAVMVIAAGPQALINRFVLGNPVMVWIGLISYPLYLWHWPLLAFNRIFSPFMPGMLRVELMGAAVVLAWLTYQFVEKPLRRSQATNSPNQARRQLVVLYGLMAALCVTGLAIFGGRVPARNTTKDVDALLAAQYDWGFPPRNFVKVNGYGQNLYTRAGTDRRYTLFIGDSVVEHFAPRVDQLLSDMNQRTFSVLFATGGGCPSVPKVSYVVAHTHSSCEDVTKTAYEIAHRSDIAKVVIGGSWERYLDASHDDFKVQSNGRYIRYGQPGAIDAAFAALEEEVARLAKTKQVYILLSTPKDKRFSPKSMLEGSRWTSLRRRQNTPAIDIRDFTDSVAPIRERLIAMAARHGVKVIDPIGALCNGTVCPVAAPNGEPYFIDDEHMRPFYVREKAGFLDQTLLVN